MSWRKEDWSEWPVERWVARCGDAAHLQAVRDILRRLPEGRRRRVVELTRGPSSWSPWLETLSGDVVAVDLERVAPGELPQASLVLAVDTLRGRQLPELLPVIHDALDEGGVFVATLPAPHDPASPIDMLGPLREDDVHEVELQYRLRRSGFQGLRLRRFRDAPPSLLAMAVRRALN
jgi:hypothetical protein